MYVYMSSTFLYQEGGDIYIYSNNKKYETVMNNEYLCKLAKCKLGEFFIIYDILTYLLVGLKLKCYLRMHGR